MNFFKAATSFLEDIITEPEAENEEKEDKDTNSGTEESPKEESESPVDEKNAVYAEEVAQDDSIVKDGASSPQSRPETEIATADDDVTTSKAGAETSVTEGGSKDQAESVTASSRQEIEVQDSTVEETPGNKQTEKGEDNKKEMDVQGGAPGSRDATHKKQGSLGGWNWGGILKTIAEKSGEVLEEYKRDIQEFTSGLREETVQVVDMTKHVVQDLPHSLENTSVIAQESLETVTHQVEDFGVSVWRGATEILGQVKEAIAKVEEEALMAAKKSTGGGSSSSSAYAAAALARQGKYSRFEAQVSAMQRDSSTYCDEPDDTDDYATWKESFKLDDKKPDIEALLKENAFMLELQSRIVPTIVEYDTFWTRYYYRLHRLQLAEASRADLVKRAQEDEEELTWDMDEDEVAKDGEAEAPEGEAISTISAEEAPQEDAPASSVPIQPATLEAPQAASDASAAAPSPGKAAATAAPEKAPTGAGQSEEDVVSEASSGSEWQVVGKDDSPTTASAGEAARAAPPAPDAAGKSPGNAGRGKSVQADNTAKGKGKAKKAAAQEGGGKGSRGKESPVAAPGSPAGKAVAAAEEDEIADLAIDDDDEAPVALPKRKQRAPGTPSKAAPAKGPTSKSEKRAAPVEGGEDAPEQDWGEWE